ncbi:Rossmann-like and DUF2520 domain-containing protein [Rufibacter sp. LB8]|uniref:Rossmann-like and DUF2520 domain-containing protein n=1 Tax=Rufibacter sp. LB8 TaxID=2777781 RepID=UPI0021022705|nr:Rossmann-like and DUF2520 domain-containing protein [Rufibacter sp. LB8]
MVPCHCNSRVTSMKIGIIGTGNVGTHLVKGLAAAGLEVVVIYSRTLAHAQEAVQFAPTARAVDFLDFTACPRADLYLLAVPDQVLPEIVAKALFPEGTVVAHTSGTQPMEVLQPLKNVQVGVFYPLQTFSKEKDVDWPRIPICWEASSPEAGEMLQQVAVALSRNVLEMAGPARRQLHVAAVFACNFTNHLWGVAQEILQTANLPVTLLQPLVEETVAKAFQFPPFAVQTGPARRNDQTTLQAHANLLQDFPEYTALYQVLTASIQRQAGFAPVSGLEAKNRNPGKPAQ